MRNAFIFASGYDGQNPVYLIWAVVEASEPRAVTGVIAAPSIKAMQAFLYENINELYEESYPYEIVQYVKLEVEADEVRITDEGSDPLQERD